MSPKPDSRAWIVIEPPADMGSISYSDGWVTIRVRPQFVQQWEYYAGNQPPTELST